MATSRRSFFGFLASALAVAAVDPEELIWQPGNKLISIPSGIVAVENYPIASVIAAQMEAARPYLEKFIMAEFKRNSLMYTAFADKKMRQVGYMTGRAR
jgi:hypothetical protein